jgi:hypothetical protein
LPSGELHTVAAIARETDHDRFGSLYFNRPFGREGCHEFDPAAVYARYPANAGQLSSRQRGRNQVFLSFEQRARWNYPSPALIATRMNAHDTLPYRPCVGAMLVNSQGQAFVGKRIDNKEGDFWQMPQGGVDPGEAPDDAVLRELWEETGATAEHVEIVARLPEELFYDLPDDLKG